MEAGANRLLTCRLRQNSEVHQELNAWARGSVLVFTIGWPFCWFFPGRAYSAEMGASVTLLDHSERYMLGDQGLGDLDAEEYFERSENPGDLQLDFIERAGDSYGYDLASVLISSPFLASDHEGLTPEWMERAMQELADEIAGGLQDRRRELLRSVTRYDFYRLVDEVVAARRPEEGLRLSWAVLHDQRQGLNEPGAFRVRAGEYDRSFEVNDPSAGGRRRHRDRAGSPSLPGHTRWRA